MKKREFTSRSRKYSRYLHQFSRGVIVRVRATPTVYAQKYQTSGLTSPSAEKSEDMYSWSGFPKRVTTRMFGDRRTDVVVDFFPVRNLPSSRGGLARNEDVPDDFLMFNCVFACLRRYGGQFAAATFARLVIFKVAVLSRRFVSLKWLGALVLHGHVYLRVPSLANR